MRTSEGEEEGRFRARDCLAAAQVLRICSLFSSRFIASALAVRGPLGRMGSFFSWIKE